MKKILTVVFIFVAVACSSTLEIEIPPIKGDPSSAILKTDIRKSGEKYILDVYIHVVDDRGQFIRILGKNNFLMNDTTIYGNQLSFRLDNVKSGTTESKGDYSALLLLDQSGSISGTDPYNSRIDASKIFLENLGERDNAGLASFVSGWSNDFNVHHGFSRDIAPLIHSLDSLGGYVGGGTPLYYSTFNLLDYVEENADHQSNKALIVFTDGGDTDGGSTPQEIIDKANLLGVQVFTVGLGRYLPNVDILWNMAQKTGGYFMWAEEAKQLISYFGTLGNLLNGNAGYHRMTWEISASNDLSGQTYLFNLTIKISDNKSLRAVVPVTFP